jgi:bifunctional DNA-binding transcriptional regulator/antitoxin component of YhaV-PrlF toxin-antitoxin module
MELLRVTSAGQLSLPARIRRRWGTQRVVIEDLGDSVVLRPIPDDPIEAAAGALKGQILPSEQLRARAREDERHAAERRARRS